MNKDYFIKLNRAIYKITETFFEKEPLKFKIREFANNILADLFLFQNFNCKENALSQQFFSVEEYQKLINKILNNIEILIAYFDLAESQNYVSAKNFLFFCQEYGKIKKAVEQEQMRINVQIQEKSSQVNIPTKIKISKPKEKSLITERQKKLLQILKSKQQAQIKEIEKEFPEKSRRTLQRDLENLISKNLIQKKGDYNELFYEIR
ncbi:MAG: hypothetical protein U9Q27_01335 [Patescibacteria group bacterium]|nr:hypothetical protein [Patescibacteria group bacterium]